MQVKQAENSVVTGLERNFAKVTEARHCTASVLYFVPLKDQVVLFHQAMSAQIILVGLRIRHRPGSPRLKLAVEQKYGKSYSLGYS